MSSSIYYNLKMGNGEAAPQFAETRCSSQSTPLSANGGRGDKGRCAPCQEIARSLISTARFMVVMSPLTPTELRILRALSVGHTNQEIADRLAITEGTAKWHLNHIYGKLGVSNRTAAVAAARGLDLLQVEDPVFR